VEVEEIKKVLWSMNGAKYPGPGGFFAQFFKEACEVVGQNMTEAVESLFQDRKLMSVVNNTYLALIPMIEKPSTISNF